MLMKWIGYKPNIYGLPPPMDNQFQSKNNKNIFTPYLGVASKPPHASLVQGDFNIKLEIAWVNS
jgi:hypothetical protein